MLKFNILFLLLLSSSISAQIISGRVYDNESTVKGAKIINTSRESITYSNGNGEFSIRASVNDTIIFSSYFHKSKKLFIDKNLFKNTIVVELKKDINTLGEVVLTNSPTIKEFNAQVYTQDFSNQLKNDIKENPHFYQPTPSGNLDLIKISSLIIKLFKNKKPKQEAIIPTTYKQYDSLFTKDKFFNEKLLHGNLNIPIKYKGLFFDYCDAKNLNSALLLKKNSFVLLDSLVKFSHEFLKIIDNYNESR